MTICALHIVCLRHCVNFNCSVISHFNISPCSHYRRKVAWAGAVAMRRERPLSITIARAKKDASNLKNRRIKSNFENNLVLTWSSLIYIRDYGAIFNFIHIMERM
jgi:hypothetical protein